jgi:4-diphosphocytidyl-2-C-methyl-D-erythritol kinase
MTVVVRAPAKINLFLRVLGRRPDGYHDLQTAVLRLDLADVLEISPATRGFSVEVAGEFADGVPTDASNLALLAAAALARRAGLDVGAHIRLDKRVPNAAGLGGGSADAAAALVTLNHTWRAGLSNDELSVVAAQMGSDVPALLPGVPVLATGRGEQVRTLDGVPALRWALVHAPFGVSTAEAFGWWDEGGAPTGPEPGPLLEAARSGDPGRIGPLLFNDLQAAVFRSYPELVDVVERLLEAGAAGVILCGSGGTVAGLLPFGVDAPAWAREVRSAPS